MSGLKHDPSHEESEQVSKIPRAIIHKQILEVARRRPNASLEGLAEEISGANINLVERVLDEYGDPVEDTDKALPDDNGADVTETDDNGADVTETDDNGADVTEKKEGETDDAPKTPEEMKDVSQESRNENEGFAHVETGKARVNKEGPEVNIDADEVNETVTETTERDSQEGMQGRSPLAQGSLGSVESTNGEQLAPDTKKLDQNSVILGDVQLTEKQRTTLKAIHDNPKATQRELADILNVSSATVNKRVNSIKGFEWNERQAFVSRMLENDSLDSRPSNRKDQQISVLSERLNKILTELHRVERKIEEQNHATVSDTPDPELVHKIAHACMSSDQITEEEELQILDYLLSPY